MQKVEKHNSHAYKLCSFYFVCICSNLVNILDFKVKIFYSNALIFALILCYLKVGIITDHKSGFIFISPILPFEIACKSENK